MRTSRPSLEGWADRGIGLRAVRLRSTGAEEPAGRSRTGLRGSFPAWAADFVYTFGSIVYRRARLQRSRGVAVYSFLPFVYTTDGVLYTEAGKIYTTGSQEREAEANVYTTRADLYRTERGLYTRAAKLYTHGANRRFSSPEEVVMGRKRQVATLFTSVKIDEELFMQGWNLSKTNSKKDFLEEAIRVYVGLHDQAQVRSLRGKLVWDGSLDDLRKEG
jgi:hypothetical protein